MSEMVTLWLVVLIVSIGVEVATLGLTSIWFAGGAVVAVIVAAFHGPVWLQILLFLQYLCSCYFSPDPSQSDILTETA